MHQNDDRDIKYLDRAPPNFSDNEARRIAADYFGLTGDFQPLESERDKNYRIQTPKGDRFVLKLSNAAEEPGVIDFQIKALSHIARYDPGLLVPRIRPAKDGAPVVNVQSVSGSRHIVRVLSYLPGVALKQVALTSTLWHSMGEMAARLDLALRGFFHPYARQEHPWDITRCGQLREHTIHIADNAARQNIEEILDHVVGEVLPRVRKMRHQVIHSDVDANNTLTDPEQPDSVTGIIDFGDMVFGPIVAEVAIAASVNAAVDEDLVDSMCAVVAGFDSVLLLEDEEIDLIYDLVLARIAVTATIIAWRKMMRPDQPEYNHESEVPCWEFIDYLRSVGRARVVTSLRRSCHFPPSFPLDDAEDGVQEVKSVWNRRRKVLGAHLRHFYTQPLHVERGLGPWLYSAQGKPLLDAYNNVPVAGHCHPRIVKAISRQAAALNTNTRYLYRSIVEYAERLVSLLPGELTVCILVNSGSEATDIAWRMARFVSGRSGALVMEDAYHGITEAIAQLTQRSLKRGLAGHVQTLESPDPYRGRYRTGQTDLAWRYAQDAERAISDLARNGFEPAAFMVDTAFVSNGIPDVPAGYLAAVSETVRQAGGLIIADEVQAGFGRLGSHMWGFMVHDLAPDIVTMGKPVGNGFPLGIVATRPEILDAFAAETGIFSTYGGNPVACAAGLAVLDVLEDEDLMGNALQTGDYLRTGLGKLMSSQPLIGDVRGRGLLVGVELVRERSSLEPADQETAQVLDLMCQYGVLVGREGPLSNVIKIRPPLVFDREHADILIEALDRALTEL